MILPNMPTAPAGSVRILLKMTMSLVKPRNPCSPAVPVDTIALRNRITAAMTTGPLYCLVVRCCRRLPLLLPLGIMSEQRLRRTLLLPLRLRIPWNIRMARLATDKQGATQTTRRPFALRVRRSVKCREVKAPLLFAGIFKWHTFAL